MVNSENAGSMKIHKIGNFKGEFFKILETTANSQVGVMTLASGKDSGPEEIHGGDQIVYIIEGEAEVEVGTEQGKLVAGELVIIPAGSRHHIWNRGKGELFFLTLYAPPAY